ncbi:MAG: amidohydrolase family protein [Ginsengibacter sp.]
MKCTDCITEKTLLVTIGNEKMVSIEEIESAEKSSFSIGPGLIDLQINGINGIDFNIPSVSVEDIEKATQFLLSIGVTTYFPTIVTNSTESILKMLGTINSACESNELVNSCVGGIHLEGPFISPKDGAKGAHDERYIKAPDWDLFSEFQKASGGRIKIITIAPEWEGSIDFIKKCCKSGVIVSIGHSLADAQQIKQAVNAGAKLSTHLGNAVPLLLPRHPNLIWDQLAADDLYACIIGDGIHVPDSFLKVVMKIKGDQTIVVSDATCFAGMPPGEYLNHIGGTIILDKEKRVSLKKSPGMLAGAGKSLLENIEYFYFNKLASLGQSWQLASFNVVKMLHKNSIDNWGEKMNDFVIFEIDKKTIKILKVIKKGRVVAG